MGYKVPDWHKLPDKKTKYDIEFPDGEVYTLPKVKYMTSEQADRMAEADQIEGGFYTVFDELAPGLGAALKKTPRQFIDELIADWQKDSGIELGESEASSDS